MTVELAPMQWWDIPEVHRIESAVFPVDPWTVEQFWAELARPTRSYVTASIEGAIVGYAGAFCLAPDADVQTIAVDAAAQGHGVGRRLLQALVDIARTAGCTHLMLEVRSDNAEAIGLYERSGFERISTRRDYYAPGVDAHIMRLRPLGVDGD